MLICHPRYRIERKKTSRVSVRLRNGILALWQLKIPEDCTLLYEDVVDVLLLVLRKFFLKKETSSYKKKEKKWLHFLYLVHVHPLLIRLILRRSLSYCLSVKPCCGFGPEWIRIDLGRLDTDPDPGGQKLPTK